MTFERDPHNPPDGFKIGPRNNSVDDADTMSRWWTDGHVATLDTQAILEDRILEVLDQSSVDPERGTLIVPLELGDKEFTSIEALRIYLGGLHWEVSSADRDIAIFHNDDYGERVPSELVDNVLAHSGIGELLAKKRLEFAPVKLFSLEEVAQPLILPASDIALVNTELITHLAKHPELIYELHPRKFEELVAEIFRDLGYETVLTPKSKDGGRDVHAIRKDSVGTMLFLIECKRWARDRPVGVEVVRGLYGVVAAEKATCGIVATTSRFTTGAKQFASQVRYQVSLRDFDNLREWLLGYKGPLRS